MLRKLGVEESKLPKKIENNNDYEVWDSNWNIVEMFS